MSKHNPLNKDEIESQKSRAKRSVPDIESDSFGTEEQKKIVKMVQENAEYVNNSRRDWVDQRKTDLQHLNNEKPSVIENLTKRGWQSDRNLGVSLAVHNIYQATLLATCYNPENTPHVRATEVNDVDNKHNAEDFTKWGLGKNEADFFPEMDDAINNATGQGFFCFKVEWEVKYEWVDERIPVWSKNKKRVLRYIKKTKKNRFERAVIRNIDDLEDIMFPTFGKRLQDAPYIIHVRHYTYADLEEMKERKVIKNVNADLKDSIKGAVLEQKRSTLAKEQREQLGLEDITEEDLMTYPVDCHEWYGMYKKGAKREMYKFLVELSTETFLSGKPMRSIHRSGKKPFFGGAFIRRPGFILGQSLMWLIAPVVNSINNVFNQKSDFQYMTNVPFGFTNPDEGFTEGVFEIEPMKVYKVDGKPQDAVYFPNLQRSMAWAYQDINFLMEVLERLTGAASYFLTAGSKSSTATRDTIVEEKGDTKFGLWVKRILDPTNEALTYWYQFYQDFAPPKLGERVLGEDGKKLFRNLSIDSLRGGYDISFVPDITSGSKAYQSKIKLWAMNVMGQSMWANPQINPRGNYNLYEDAAKSVGMMDPERYLGPRPSDVVGTSREVETEWHRFMQGEVVEIPEGENSMEHLAGHRRQQTEKFFDLDESYRDNFLNHLFQTEEAARKQAMQAQVEQMANQIASNAAGRINGAMSGGGMQPGAGGGGPAQPGAAPADPGGVPIGAEGGTMV